MTLDLVIIGAVVSLIVGVVVSLIFVWVLVEISEFLSENDRRR